VNRPFLAYQLALLAHHGVNDVVLSCGYRVDDVRAALGDETFGVRLRYVVETEPLGTGGGVRNAADIAHGTIYVLNGDILTDADLTAMRQLHASRGARVTILLTRVADPRAYGLVETDAGGRLVRFREKPGPGEAITTDTVNAGVYLIDADLLARMPAGRPVSIEREFFPALIADGVPCFGVLASGYWRDIGSPAAYLAAQLDLLDGRVDRRLSLDARDASGVERGPGTQVAPGARVIPPAVLGASVTVEGGARVGPRAVLGDGCRLGKDAVVHDAVLWERVAVGDRAVLAGCVVGAGARIDPDARLAPGAVVESGGVVAAGTPLTGESAARPVLD
jgi:mannose-1-phosphate guanylyltransferase